MQWGAMQQNDNYDFTLSDIFLRRQHQLEIWSTPIENHLNDAYPLKDR